MDPKKRKSRAKPATTPPEVREDQPSVPSDPVESAELSAAVAALKLSDEQLTTIRGLWHAGREIVAIRIIRERAPKQENGEEFPLREAMELAKHIVATGPAPEGFVVPSVESPPPTLEESIVPAANGEVVPFPSPPARPKSQGGWCVDERPPCS